MLERLGSSKGGVHNDWSVLRDIFFSTNVYFRVETRHGPVRYLAQKSVRQRQLHRLLCVIKLPTGIGEVMIVQVVAGGACCQCAVSDRDGVSEKLNF
jgi:hypothetical protein